jgi:hypothetical protein
MNRPTIMLKGKLEDLNYDTQVAGLKIESLGKLLISSNGPNNGMEPKDYVGLGLVLERLGKKLARMSRDLDLCAMIAPEDLPLREATESGAHHKAETE